jgi:SagB-type dehydrogenase family enzyme
MDHIALPPPDTTGSTSLEETLSRRRSVRQFDNTPLSPQQLGQILWAAHGITDAEGHRTAPSAGATDPLAVLAVTREGLYRYEAGGHRLEVISSDDRLDEIAEAARDDRIQQAGAVVAIVADERPTVEQYSERGERYVLLEAGHAAQNVLLQAVSLDLGAYPVGSFDDAAVAARLSLESEQRPLYLIPIGHT